MITVNIPGRGEFNFNHAVLDVNGTLATDGRLIKGVEPRLIALSNHLDLHLLTSDTHGRQSEIDEALQLVATRISPGQESDQKVAFVSSLGAQNVIAIGNGANDAGMLKTAGIGIGVIGEEGLNVETLLASDLVCPNIVDALDLLLIPQRLVATLRK
jgi:P-type E1-E2 ATPase